MQLLCTSAETRVSKLNHGSEVDVHVTSSAGEVVVLVILSANLGQPAMLHFRACTGNFFKFKKYNQYIQMTQTLIYAHALRTDWKRVSVESSFISPEGPISRGTKLNWTEPISTICITRIDDSLLFNVSRKPAHTNQNLKFVCYQQVEPSAYPRMQPAPSAPMRTKPRQGSGKVDGDA